MKLIKIRITNKTLFLLVNILTYLIIITILFSIGIKDQPDSNGYINMGINRGPGYPLFINLFQIIFGQFYKLPLLVIQLLWGLFGTHIISKTIKKSFKLTALCKELNIECIIISSWRGNHITDKIDSSYFTKNKTFSYENGNYVKLFFR